MIEELEEELAKLGRLLLAEGLITREELTDSLKDYKSDYGKIAEILKKLIPIKLEELAAFLGLDYMMPKIPDLRDVKITQELLDILPEKLAYQYRIIPVARFSKILCIACADINEETIKEIREATKLKIKAIQADKGQIEKALEKFYAGKGVELPAPQKEDQVEAREPFPLVLGPSQKKQEILDAIKVTDEELTREEDVLERLRRIEEGITGTAPIEPLRFE